MLDDELHEVRSKLQENDLIRVWLERKHDEQSLKDILPQIKINHLAEDLSKWLRSKLEVVEDIDLMKDYTNLSAFNMEKIGLLTKKRGP